jgi:methylenetetrahydrofolate dehydrogenase (NADP+) / methenyltetrahydrofolate cyclohydrolase
MSAVVLDGRSIAALIREHVKVRAAKLRERNIIPKCAIILIEGDEPGRLYAQQIARSATPLGVDIDIRQLPKNSSTNEVLVEAAKIVDDPHIQAMMVQRPLPAGFDAQRIAEEIDPRKDVDGAHPYNQGLLVAGETFLPPATAAAVMELLHQPQVSTLDGARAIVLGRSAVVGRPVALMLTAANATVTICHSHTKNLPAVAREGDIVVAAVGHPKFVGPDMIKPGATVIDVGTNFVDGHFVGDVDYEAVSGVAGVITPVPGGVGPVTTAVLLRSIVEAAERSR